MNGIIRVCVVEHIVQWLQVMGIEVSWFQVVNKALMFVIYPLDIGKQI